MRKIIVSAVFLAAMLGNIHISGQEKIGLQKYDYVTNGDANIFQGIPNIGIPIFNLDIPTTGVGINLSISYTTESLAASSLISDVGKGWNLSTVGSIVRSKTRIAEDYTKSTAFKPASSDVYYYNYPGGSGKFFITEDSVSHELEAVHTSPANDKITFIKDTNEGKIKSFTIKDTKGNTYLFDKVNINKMIIGGISSNQKYTNSGFLLTKIFNVKNDEVANIEYETRTQQIGYPAGTLQQNKIKKITVNGIGSIEYIYKHNGAAPLLTDNSDRDWYILDKLVLKDTRGAVMNQYAFERPLDNLTGLINLDKNNIQIQKTRFEYNDDVPLPFYNTYDSFGYVNSFQYCDFDNGILHSPEGRNRNVCSFGALKSIILPSGGRTEYEFESQSLYHGADASAPSNYYDNYPFEKIQTITYRTEPGEYPAPFTVPGDYKVAAVKVEAFAYGPSGPHGTPPTYTLYINGVEPQPYDYPDAANNTSYCQNMYKFESEGTLTFTFQGKSQGTIELYAFKKNRIDENDYGHGLRIKSIKNFNTGSSAPVSYTKYEYNVFDNALRSSGVVLDDNMDISYMDEFRKEVKPIGYTNIKVTNMIDGNYSKYYYKDPYAITPGITPSYSSKDHEMDAYLRTMGILERKEDFNAANLPLQKTEIAYQFKEVPIANILDGTNNAKKINISKQSSVTETYVSGTSKKLVSSSETNTEDKYNNVTYTKETLPDGSIVEKTFLYPEDKGIQKLLTANMVNIPLETSTKKNGKLVGKAETKFDDASHLYPTSVISYNMQTQTPVTASTLDVYDSKGNLVQTTGKNGIPVTTIWGYYQTQPIAVITGATYAQVSSLATVTAAVNASNADRDNPALEPQLVTALDNLRKDPALQNYTVTATTYDPMVGVTSSISANGIRTVNVYDAANRLIKTTDAAGKTLQEYKYNYKN
ncbi:hypothetical protein H9Q08_05190 [Chryseobacterium sp. PS-8]|uniref:YD repeat-containing protein n=1 Tax=Chryseobacterium indicum TaxID=2766954 RepID=A0ABS9C369_9FLAO|nr:hypothetical protein [Chryseobacterium sp. PS-8]MCF2218693.1 hypothetical protein [Chryseobacterium sp. PS-8]